MLARYFHLLASLKRDNKAEVQKVALNSLSLPHLQVIGLYCTVLETTKTFHFAPNCSIRTVDNLRLGHKPNTLSNYLSARCLFLKIMRSVPVEITYSLHGARSFLRS